MQTLRTSDLQCSTCQILTSRARRSRDDWQVEVQIRFYPITKNSARWRDKEIIRSFVESRSLQETSYERDRQIVNLIEKTEKTSRFLMVGWTGRRRVYEIISPWSLSRRYVKTSRISRIGSTKLRRAHDPFELIHLFNSINNHFLINHAVWVHLSYECKINFRPSSNHRARDCRFVVIVHHSKYKWLTIILSKFMWKNKYRILFRVRNDFLKIIN